MKDDAISSKEDSGSTLVIPLLLQDPNHVTYEVSFERRMMMNMTVKETAGPGKAQVEYWIDTWRNNSKPDLIVHEGKSGEGKVVGTCVFGKRWGGIFMTNEGRMGDFTDFQYKAHYAKAPRDKFGRYASPLDLVLTNGATSRTFHFARTTDGPTSLLGKVHGQNWTVTNSKGELVAFWKDSGKCLFSLTRGSLTVNPRALEREDDFLYLLMTMLSLKEIARRMVQGIAVAAGAAGGSA
ncbi:hypothetical protein QFC19_002506 [Naganishia cerealis]|uniref:Uncharacterized protein n=1 Tax=Naganishia cerealis TaxID=610337 RepID=A0ACC2WA07_9TREE|nr:hypothetical protein QFC19_002506 [Naganishia cerealis]